MEIVNKDKEILARVLTTEEIDFLKGSYQLYKGLKAEDLKEIILRRINDVVSIARYLDMMNGLDQSLYDCLTERLSNLRIVVDNIENPPKEPINFRYVADHYKNPRILVSIGYLDHARYSEVGALLSETAASPESGEQIDNSLYAVSGPTHQVIYYYDSTSTIIYDIERTPDKKEKRKDLKDIREACQRVLKSKASPIIEKSYDEMVYQKVNFNMCQHNVGYRLVKKYPEER